MKAARQLTGAMFCVAAAFLYGINYLAAVIYAPEVGNWNTQVGRVGEAYKTVGRELQGMAVVFLVIGIVYILVAEFQAPPDDKAD